MQNITKKREIQSIKSDDVSEKILKQAIKSSIDLIMLSKLQNATMSGYDVMVSIQKEFGIYISPGMIYSHLYSLERDEIICSFQNREKRMYKITEKGKQHLELSINSTKNILDNLRQEIIF